jgi:hypothetical protein
MIFTPTRRFAFILIFTLIWSSYLFVQWYWADDHWEIGTKGMIDQNIRRYDINPFDNFVSGIEDVIFGMICPFFTAFMCMSLYRQLEGSEGWPKV